MPDIEDKRPVPAPSVIKEFLTKGRRGGLVQFTADEESERVVISVKEDADIFEIPIPGPQLVQIIIALFEQIGARVMSQDKPGEHLVFQCDKEGRIKLLFFREDHPLVLRRSVSESEICQAYALAVGVQNGNFLAKPAKKKKSSDD